MSDSKPPVTPHILSADEKKKAAQESLRADRKRRLRQHSAEAVSYILLIAGSLLVLALAWIKTAWMLSRPPKFPFSLQYATVQDREVAYALEFPDPNGVPPDTRAIPAAERRLPFVVLAGQPARASFAQSFQPAAKKLELVIPRGIEPGTWTGRLMIRDTQQRDIANLPVSFIIADPYRLYKVGGIAFLLFTASWYSLLIWRRPSPRGRLLMTEILASDRVGEPKLDVKTIQHPWWRKWIWLPGRNRKHLHDLHKRLPEGEIVFRRRGMFKRRQRVAMDLKLASVETSGLVQTRVWPSSTKAARQIPQRPQASIPIEPDGTPWVVSTDTASDGKAISFTIHHPDKTPTKKP